jgi:hypothetical protein
MFNARATNREDSVLRWKTSGQINLGLNSQECHLKEGRLNLTGNHRVISRKVSPSGSKPKAVFAPRRSPRWLSPRKTPDHGLTSRKISPGE